MLISPDSQPHHRPFTWLLQRSRAPATEARAPRVALLAHQHALTGPDSPSTCCDNKGKTATPGTARLGESLPIATFATSCHGPASRVWSNKQAAHPSAEIREATSPILCRRPSFSRRHGYTLSSAASFNSQRASSSTRTTGAGLIRAGRARATTRPVQTTRPAEVSLPIAHFFASPAEHLAPRTVATGADAVDDSTLTQHTNSSGPVNV